MAKDLPGEMISEILSPVLEVPEHKFSDLSPTSPFAKYSVSSSALLLVCKAWLRVATPLLYHVVILRSRAQARALHDALQKNKDLGRFVKKLRVEGGFGRFMQHVLHSSPNITDLFISLQIHESDSTSGFAAALPSINPTRVIIFDDHENRLKDKGVLQLMSSLSGCVNNWTNLHTLVLPYPTSVPSRHNFVLSMCAGSNLKIVSCPFPSTSPDITPLLIEIAKHPGLEAVELRQKSTQKQLSLPTSNNARLTSLLRWADDPVWVPLETLPPSV
ncbi:hypothetical protein B0H11DRAFT_1344430 [Mycena galericulata]|nr:hypothetical protein B0H11DRAFT_1344430 [Mycena galericulata]